MEFKKVLFKRLDKYVRIDTASDPSSKTSPSTKTQLAFAEILKKELEGLGVKTQISKHGVLTAKLPSNTVKKLPAIGFIAHMDTESCVPTKNIKPKLHKNYKGGPLQIKKDMFINDPRLKECVGDDILTSSGDTLLGADDKGGIAAIMTCFEYFARNPEVKHGPVCAAFTPDEEVGRGHKNFDIKAFGADFAYTIDGPSFSDIIIGNFNADNGAIHIKGVSGHFGYAKGVLVSPARLVGEIISQWPEKFMAENTEGNEPFLLFGAINGDLAEAKINVHARAFKMAELLRMENMLKNICKKTERKYKGAEITVEFHEYFRNMEAELKKHPAALNALTKALKAEQLPYKLIRARAGTDGAALTLRGLPCPDIFAAYSNMHGLYEWCSLDKLSKVTNLLIRIVTNLDPDKK